MLPTNVFLQNVTASAYLVEVLDRSGLLEIVAQGGVASVAASLTTGQQLDEEGDFRNEKTTFRVSAVRLQLKLSRICVLILSYRKE